MQLSTPAALQSGQVGFVSNSCVMHQERGGNLVQEHVFGQDPLKGHEQLKLLREHDFYLHMPSMEEPFKNVLHMAYSLNKQRDTSFP